MIDTGSEVNLISRDALQRAGAIDRIRKLDDCVVLTTLSGEIDAEEEVTLDWSPNNATKSYRHTFLVTTELMNEPFDILIGTGSLGELGGNNAAKPNSMNFMLRISRKSKGESRG